MDMWSSLMIKLKSLKNEERKDLFPASFQMFLFVFQILQNYKDNSKIRRFLTKLDFYVLPVFNIDGYIYTWTTVSRWSLVLG